MSRTANLIGLLIILALVILFYTQIPLTTASLFGDDEGCELMKAAMVNKGYALYTDIWNDQPPIFTLLLSYVFKIFGTSLVAGRLVAAAFGLLMFGSFYWLVAQRLGRWKAIVAAFLLMAAPDVALLSASAMLEVPAFATALLAACFLHQWTKQQRMWWLVASGIVMGVALQIKLTAILIAPAMLVEIFWAGEPQSNQSRWKMVLRPVLQWGAAATITILAIIGLWARGSISISLKSHFEEQPPVGMIGPKDFPFQIDLLGNHVECVVAALLIMTLAIWRSFASSQKNQPAQAKPKVHNKRSQKAATKIQKAKITPIRVGYSKTAKGTSPILQIAFPTIFLFTVSCIHAVHRPWWGYYYLHLAIPLAWLSALAVGHAIDLAAQLFSASNYCHNSTQFWQGIILCTLAAFILIRSEQRFEITMKALRKQPVVTEDLVVTKMKQYARQTHWVYAEQDIYPFQAGFATPPELTVVVLKRFWSGQITTSMIIDTCEHYHPEQLVLNPAHVNNEWNTLLRNYEIAYYRTNVVLYVTKQSLN